jgi:ribosomal protein S18 acetylase RimI-like enzyme
VTARLVEPLPAGLSLAQLHEVEDAGLRASQPPVQQLLDGWLVRLQPGKAKRARCVNALQEGERPLSEKLSLCQALYRAAGLTCYVRITPFSAPAGLDVELGARGWMVEDPTRVLVMPDVAAVPALATPTGVEVQEDVPAADYAQVVGTLRGSTAAQIEAHAARLAASPVPYRGVVWRAGPGWPGDGGLPGAVLACGQVACDGELAGLYDVFTAPAVRSRGLATALCASLLQDAAARDRAQVGYLQVDAGNVAARRVYARLGFLDAYGYHYRVAPAG